MERTLIDGDYVPDGAGGLKENDGAEETRPPARTSPPGSGPGTDHTGGRSLEQFLGIGVTSISKISYADALTLVIKKTKLLKCLK